MHFQFSLKWANCREISRNFVSQKCFRKSHGNFRDNQKFRESFHRKEKAHGILTVIPHGVGGVIILYNITFWEDKMNMFAEIFTKISAIFVSIRSEIFSQ
jgi:hypothetical protein